MNFYHQCREVTIELSGPSSCSSCPNGNKTPSNVLDYWNYNQEAYMKFLIQGTYGFRGIVKDATPGGDIIDAKISIIGRDDQTPVTNSWVETETMISGVANGLGDFYRPIEAGTYDILIEADCYNSVTLSNQTIANYQTINLGDILLTPSTPVPTSLSENSITSNSATLNWDDMGVTSYDVRYRINGSSDSWIETNVTTNSLDVNSLSSETTYEYQIRSICTSASSYTSLELFTTLAVNYCSSSGDTGSAGITNVSFSSIDNSDATNTNSGYEDFSAISTDVDLDESYSLSVRVTATGGANQSTYIRAFIDFNRDGDFNDSGETIDLGTVARNSTNSLTSGSPYSIQIPLAATLGTTKMRIASKKGSAPTSCESFSNGEVENYTVNIIDSTLGVEDELLSQFEIYPNPTDGNINLSLPQDIFEFKVY